MIQREFYLHYWLDVASSLTWIWTFRTYKQDNKHTAVKSFVISYHQQDKQKQKLTSLSQLYLNVIMAKIDVWTTVPLIIPVHIPWYHKLIKSSTSGALSAFMIIFTNIYVEIWLNSNEKIKLKLHSVETFDFIYLTQEWSGV